MLTYIVAALVVIAAVLIWRIHDKASRIEEKLSKQEEESEESSYEHDQRLAEETECREQEVIGEFRIFQQLGIRPTDEWRLRAAKLWKIPTAEELDHEVHVSLISGSGPNDRWFLRAAMLPEYEYCPPAPDNIDKEWARSSAALRSSESEVNAKRERILAARAAKASGI